MHCCALASIFHQFKASVRGREEGYRIQTMKARRRRTHPTHAAICLPLIAMHVHILEVVSFSACTYRSYLSQKTNIGTSIRSTALCSTFSDGDSPSSNSSSKNNKKNLNLSASARERQNEELRRLCPRLTSTRVTQNWVPAKDPSLACCREPWC